MEQLPASATFVASAEPLHLFLRTESQGLGELEVPVLELLERSARGALVACIDD